MINICPVGAVEVGAVEGTEIPGTLIEATPEDILDDAEEEPAVRQYVDSDAEEEKENHEGGWIKW